MYPRLKDLAAIDASIVIITSAAAQSARDIVGPSPLVTIETEPPPELIVDPPLPEPPSRGLLFIQYGAVNLRVAPIFG